MPASTARTILLCAGVFCGSYLLVSLSRASGSDVVAAPTDPEYVAAIQGYEPLTFATLSTFDYRDGMPLAALPEAIRRAHGRKIALRGFMVPTTATGEGVSRFLLNGSYDMCMFGAGTGSPNQWVDVAMVGSPGTELEFAL